MKPNTPPPTRWDKVKDAVTFWAVFLLLAVAIIITICQAIAIMAEPFLRCWAYIKYLWS